MSKYQIIRWNVVTDCNGTLRPMIYFKPNPEIVLQIQDNKNYLYLNIDECELYSGKMIPAVVDIAAQQPNFRPNFFEACHLYCATLIDSVWYGYPSFPFFGSFSVYTGVIIPTCWRSNNNCPGQSKGIAISGNEGDACTTGVQNSCASGLVCTPDDSGDFSMGGKGRCMVSHSGNEGDACTTGVQNSCASGLVCTPDDSGDFSMGGKGRCMVSHANKRNESFIKSNENYNVLDFYARNKNQTDLNIPTPTLHGEIIAGVKPEPPIDFHASPKNYASINVTEDQKKKAHQISDVEKQANALNAVPLDDPSRKATVDEILDAEVITRNPPETSESSMMPRFDTRQRIPTRVEAGPKTKFIEKYKSNNKNSLITGLIVLIILLVIAIAILNFTAQ